MTDMGKPDKRRRFRLDASTVDQWIGVAISLVCLDLMTGRHLATLGQRYREWAVKNWQPTDPLSAADITGLHNERRRATGESDG